MPNIAVIDGGAYYHHRALYGERFRGYFADVIYARDLPSATLADYDAVLVPDRVHADLLRAAAPQLNEVLAHGKTLVVLGENQAQTWLPNIIWNDRPTNFWWWKTPGASLGLRAAAPNHALFTHLAIKDATWHYHGYFTPPAGALPLIALNSGEVLLYEDTVSTKGRLVLSSLDPFYHYGSYFMPVTERFLQGFLDWLHGSLTVRGPA